MLTRKEDHLRDGKHCDLCGCTSPAVRCDKCNSQIFCLSCDDMYHRHPKRRSHLRKAVDSFNASAFRPVTPNKPPPGDPSKMPIPPPRKKKPRNFFGTLMRGSPTQEGPALPKKEFSWTDRLGSIKRFMSNRPLPPLPVESSPSPEPILPVGTIYQNVPDKPNMQPILPRWSGNPTSTNDVHPMNGNSTSPELDGRPLSPRQQQCLENGQWRTNRMRNSIGETGKWRQGSKIPSDGPISPIASSAEDKHRLNHSGLIPGYATFRKITPHRGVVRSRSPSPSPTKEQNSSMHQSASLTDLHSLPTTPGPYPYFSPHHPPFFPFPPSHSYAHLNCPQCYAGQWPPPSADNCEYCNASDDNSQQKHTHHPLASRVKRSQSVMYDPMHNPVPYFPYPPGFGPFYPHGHHIEAPPSPASSARSLQNTRHSRKKHGDDNISVASSVRSRGKSSSSHQKSPDNESMEISSDEQQDDDDDDDDEDRGKEPVIKNQEMMEVERQTAPSPQSNASKLWIPTKPWSCEYCTYLNSAGVRICTVCCKTVSNVRTPSNTTPEQNLNPPESQKLPSANSRLIPEENMSLSNNGHLDAKANTMQITALEEAEKKKKSKRKKVST